MLVFILFASILVCITLAIILWPLITTTKNTDNALHKELYKKRLQELENDKQKLDLSEEEYQQQLTELQNQLLYDDEHKANTNEESSKIPALTLSLICCSVIVGSSLLYAWLGTGKIGLSHNIPTQEDVSNLSIETLKDLEEKITQANSPGDKWYELGRLYFSHGHFADSQRVFKVAIDKQPDNGVYHTDYAEALIMLNKQQVSSEAETSLQKALSIDPHNPKALWLMALASAQKANVDKQLEYLTRLQSLLNPEEEVYAQISGLINQIKQEANTATVKQTDAQISVNISIDESLKQNISADDIVFVYAKALEGPPMPLAVAKFNYNALPETIVLNDAMAMMPNLLVSNHKEVEVTVLISKSGKIGINQGDLKGSLKPVTTDKSEITIKVDTVIE